MAVSLLPSSAASGPEPVGPISTGIVPALADGFLSRTETAPRLPSALAPGAVIALVPEGTGVPTSRRTPYRPAGRAASAMGEVDIIADWSCVTGKTQMAAAYAEWLYRSGGAIIWVDAWSRACVLAGYASAVAALGVEVGQGADVAARRLLAVLEQRAQPWLLVLDGLRNVADVQGLIPSGPAGMTLITAADDGLIPESWDPMIVTLGPFSAREAMSYVRGRLTADLDQRAGMIDLVTEVGGDPSALAQACGVVQTSQLSCREYAQRLTVRREQIASAAGASPPVAAVAFSLAVERAHQLDAAAWPALTIAAMLGGQRVPWAVFGSVTVGRFVTGEPSPEASVVGQTLRLLARLGLLCVDPEPEGPVVRLSQPVVAAVRSGLTQEDYERVLAAAAAGLTEAWPAGEPSARLGSLLTSCSVDLWRAGGNQLWAQGGCPPLLRRAGAFLVSAGMLSAAVPFWADLSATAERLLRPDHPDRLEIAGKFAALLMAADEPVKASERYEWISEQVARNPGADHAAPIAAQLDLGKSLAAAGQHGEALSVLELAAADSRRLLGPDHLDTVAAAEDLAAACLQADDPRRAVTLYQQALADRIRLQGARHADAISARHRLANAHLAAGETRAAVSEGKKVVADRERELGKDNLDTMAALGDLGTALLAAGRYEQAVQLLEQALAGYERLVGADRRDTLARRIDLARGYDAIGWIVDAGVLLRETAASCERLLPAGDPLTAEVRELLNGLPQH